MKHTQNNNVRRKWFISTAQRAVAVEPLGQTPLNNYTDPLKGLCRRKAGPRHAGDPKDSGRSKSAIHWRKNPDPGDAFRSK